MRLVPRSGDRHKVRPVTFRPPEALWAEFKRKVSDEGKTVTEVLVRLIRRYLDE